jgi:Flp pilus assembly protein TadD
MNFKKPSKQQLNDLLEYYQAGRYADAEKLSLSITQEFPEHQFAWKVLGAALKQMGKINESLVAIQKSVELDPQDAKAHYNLGVMFKELGRLDEAEVSYRKAIALKPELTEAHNNLGNILKELGKLDEAEVSYRKAIALKPELTEAHNNLGNILKELGKLDEAEASYRQTITLKLDYAEAHYNLGIILQELGRLNEAEISYRQTITLKPELTEAHNNLGNILKELGKLEEAETSYRKAITLKPDFAEAHNNLGIILKELGKLEEAETSYRKAITLKPDFAEAHNNLEITLNEKKLWKITQKAKVENELIEPNFTKDLFSKVFVSNRSVEIELFEHLYKIKSIEISKTKNGPLYGAGSTTNYQLFKNDYSILKTVEQDLTNIIKKAVKSKIYIYESFYNILKVGGGSVPHTHISNFDKRHGLINQKFSLVYYISVGDQNTKDPGILKLYDPDEEILPSDGSIAIFPGNRKHSSIYSGTSDRVMIGVNFYSL